MTDARPISGKETQNCANCGKTLQGDFCAHCGQSVAEITVAFLPLISDAIDGIFAWDGRFLTTLRSIYLRPGRVARDYVEGRRARYSAPVRLYLIVSLLFFALMAVSSVRIIAIEPEIGDDGRPGMTVSLFQSGETSPGIPDATLPEDDPETPDVDESDPGRFGEMAIQAIRDPATLENKATDSANLALILMVIVFALLNLIVHPRRRIIDHLIHALYFHAAALPIFAFLFFVGAYLPLNLPVAIAYLIISYGGISLLHYGFDRGFYDSSWWGAILRGQFITIFYVLAAVFVALGLLYIAAM
jgi:hypothetical protein